VGLQVAVIWAVQKGYVDQVPVDDVKEFQAKWSDFLISRKAALLSHIETEKCISDAIAAELKSAADEFGPAYKASKQASQR
jgi:F-type H+-transporting ATPase subunit alpha